MVKERVLAVPDTSIFIAELPEATRNIIRKGRKSGKVGLSIGELFENFVADLICGTHTNGSDERMYIKQWFDRCYFSIMPEETFLSYLLEMQEIDSVLECWEILQELKEMEEPDWRYSRTSPEELQSPDFLPLFFLYKCRQYGYFVFYLLL